MQKDSRIYVAGHRGLVGSAILARLKAEGYSNLITASREQLDLRDQEKTDRFFEFQWPEYVFLCAAKVGGIAANSARPADFLYDNLMIQTNVLAAANRHSRKLLFLGSSCIYPRDCPQPIKEEYLLTGPLEPTNEPYAVAKIAGIKLCQAYRKQAGFNAICLMPTNLYGPRDNFDLHTSHVLPALIRKFHEAKLSGAPEVVVWGTGTPKRELMHVDDLADAALFLMRNYDSPEIINVGTGFEHSIVQLAGIVAAVVGYHGTIAFDSSKPDGTPRKLLNVSRLAALGWTAKILLVGGIRTTYEWYKAQVAA